MKNWRLWLIFLAGIILGALAATYFNETSYQQTLKLHEQGQLAEVIVRANNAYFTQPLPVARWELEHLEELLQSRGVSVYESPDRINFHLFVTKARLAKIYNQVGENNKYQTYITAALHYGRPLFPNMTNTGALFDMLSRIDRSKR